MKTTIIGIDNGNKGGIAALSIANGEILATFPMPTKERNEIVIQNKRLNLLKSHGAVLLSEEKKKKSFNQIDFNSLRSLILSIDDPEKCMAVFEECPFHMQRTEVMRSMANNMGIVSSVLESLEIPTLYIQSRDWHPKILGKFPKGKSKERAEEVALKLWPDQEWIRTPRSKKIHDGILDAALIAEHGRRIINLNQL